MASTRPCIPDQSSRESYLAHCRDKLRAWTPPPSGPTPHEALMRGMQEELARLEAHKAQLARELAKMQTGLSQQPRAETDEALMASGQWRDPKTNMI